MARIRSRSSASAADPTWVAIPPSLSPDIQAAGVLLLTRAEAMGLIATDDLLELSPSSLHAALDAFAKAGIGRLMVSDSQVGDDIRGALDLMNHAVEASPHPLSEWTAMIETLGWELVSTMTGVSESSARRYAHQQRQTPTRVAIRLHWIAMRVADLAGSYNRHGVQRWFQRRRRALQGDAPMDRLVGDWSPEDEQVEAVAELASRVINIGAS